MKGGVRRSNVRGYVIVCVHRCDEVEVILNGSFTQIIASSTSAWARNQRFNSVNISSFSFSDLTASAASPVGR